MQRRRTRLAKPPVALRPRPRPARALSVPQQQAVLELLHAPRFADQAPAEIYASLLDEGVYHCSIRTMYRLLGQNGEVRERRAQLRHPVYQKPELLAQRPNEVWSVIRGVKSVWFCTGTMRFRVMLGPPGQVRSD